MLGDYLVFGSRDVYRDLEDKVCNPTAYTRIKEGYCFELCLTNLELDRMCLADRSQGWIGETLALLLDQCVVRSHLICWHNCPSSVLIPHHMLSHPNPTLSLYLSLTRRE